MLLKMQPSWAKRNQLEEAWDMGQGVGRGGQM